MPDDPNDASALVRVAGSMSGRTKPARRFDVRSPYDGTVLGSVPDFDCGTLVGSLDEGSRAAGKLQGIGPVQTRLLKWAGRIALHREQLARTVSIETGKPIRFARLEVSLALATLDSYCSSPVTPPGNNWATARVVFSISNWCAPVLTVVREAAAVLSSGRALVLKSSSRASLVSLALASLWNEGDDFDGLVGVVSSTDPISMLRTALMEPQVGEVRFHGSRDVATHVSRACLEAGIPLTISSMDEVSLVVDTYADIDGVGDAIVNRAFCVAMLPDVERVARLYVRESVADSLISIVAEKAAGLRFGDPSDDETEIGPLIDDVAAALVREQVEDALADGATLPGHEATFEGREVRPIVLDHVEPFMRVCNEALEGPLLPVIRFIDPSQLLETQRLTTKSLIWSGMGESADWSRLQRHRPI
jgi:acyl-CoA reductase-like NAD-dependent aldehyde dehydrogenase